MYEFQVYTIIFTRITIKKIYWKYWNLFAVHFPVFLYLFPVLRDYYENHYENHKPFSLAPIRYYFGKDATHGCLLEMFFREKKIFFFFTY